MGPYRHIVAPTDFSEPSQQALDAAVDLAATFGAKLTIVHTFEIPWYAYAGQASIPVDCISSLEETARMMLSGTLEHVRRRIPDATAELRTGVPWEQTVAAVEEIGADLVVMGTHGRSGIAHALIGSVAEKVARHSPVPVLTIRPRRADGTRQIARDPAPKASS